MSLCNPYSFIPHTLHSSFCCLALSVRVGKSGLTRLRKTLSLLSRPVSIGGGEKTRTRTRTDRGCGGRGRRSEASEEFGADGRRESGRRRREQRFTPSLGPFLFLLALFHGAGKRPLHEEEEIQGRKIELLLRAKEYEGKGRWGNWEEGEKKNGKRKKRVLSFIMEKYIIHKPIQRGLH